MKKVILYMGLFALAMFLKIKQLGPDAGISVLFALSFGLAGLHLFEMLLPTLKSGASSKTIKFTTIIVLVALTVTNILARKYEQIYDLSSYQNYSFREQTKEWLGKIQEPIEVMIFIANDQRYFGFAEWFKKQASLYTSHLTVSIKNINKEIELAERYGVKYPNEAVVLAGDQWAKVDNFEEKNLVTGIVRVLNKTSASLCFVEGHGEPHTFEKNESGLKELYDHFRSIGYKVRSIRFDKMNAETIASQCQLVALFAPSTDFLPQEQDVLLELSKSKIPFWIGLERPLPNAMKQWLKTEGLELSEGYIVDQAKIEKNELGRDLNFRPRDFSAILDVLQSSVYMTSAYAVKKISTNPLAIDYTASLSSDPLGRYHLMSSEDTPPYVICWQGQRGDERLRYVCGQVSWMTNKNLNFADNRQMAVAIVQWLLGEEGQGWVQQPVPTEPPIVLSENELLGVKIACLYGIPSLVFALSFGYWFLRRWKS